MSQAVQTREQKLIEKAQTQELIEQIYQSEGRKNPPVTENRHLARSVVAIVVAISLLMIAPIKLNSRRSKLISEFKTGDGSQYAANVYDSVDTSIKQAASYSRDMISAMGVDAPQGENLTNLIAALNEIIADDTDEARVWELNQYIYALTDAVYNEYIQNGGSERRVTSEYNAFHTQQNVTNNFEYWNDAAKYNQARSEFPANTLGAIYSIDYVPAK